MRLHPGAVAAQHFLRPRDRQGGLRHPGIWMTAAPRDPEPLLAHTTWVRKLALHLCADVHAAEDAAQETWAAALRRPPRDPERTRGFLARTLRNMLAMSGRSERRRTRREQLAALPADAADVDASELVARAELHRQLVVVVLKLPEVPRELVLRHYFEGDDVATLARRTGLSPSAVRAQLRRARERLRADLERDGGEAARAFGLLVAASRPEVWGTGGIAATAGGVTIMKLEVLLGAAAAIAVLWFAWPLVAPQASVAGPTTSTDAAAAAVTRAAPDSTMPTDATPVTRTEAVVDPAAAPVELQGQLVGIHPDVPWTTPLVVRATGSTTEARHEHDDRITVAADGAFRVTLPEWFRRGERGELRLQGNDPFYLPAGARLRPTLSDREQPITVPVEPVSIVTGKVVDPRGAPVPAAHVGAFLPPDAERSGPPSGDVFMRCATTTDADGNYRMQVPAQGPLLLLAVPMQQRAAPSARQMLEEGSAGPGNVVHRDDLLPAHARVATRWGKVTDVPELRLTAPAFVTGSVVTGEGAPVAGVEVVWIHNSADGSLYDRVLGNLMTWADGNTGRIALGKTDANGRFRLPATPGKEGVCYPRDAQGRAEPMVTMVTATPPAEVAFRLDGGVAVVRVLCGGLPVRGVAITTDTIGDQLTPYERRRQTNARGEVKLLRSQRATQKFHVERPGNTAMDVEVPASSSANQPLVVELPPLPTAPVTIEFESAFRVNHVELGWGRTDAEVVPLQLVGLRNDGDGPFRFDVPPGRYEVFVKAPRSPDRRDTFVLDSTHEVEVPLHGRDLYLPVAHGGRVLITMTDRDGRYASGGATLVASAGKFTWGLGSEPQDSPNVPAGKYELQIRSRNRTVHQAAVEVRSCEVTDVRVRLP
jgi:RNA polymerase sigma factor (sigma-70 family)